MFFWRERIFEKSAKHSFNRPFRSDIPFSHIFFSSSWISLNISSSKNCKTVFFLTPITNSLCWRPTKTWIKIIASNSVYSVQFKVNFSFIFFLFKIWSSFRQTVSVCCISSNVVFLVLYCRDVGCRFYLNSDICIVLAQIPRFCIEFPEKCFNFVFISFFSLHEFMRFTKNRWKIEWKITKELKKIQKIAYEKVLFIAKP